MAVTDQADQDTLRTDLADARRAADLAREDVSEIEIDAAGWDLPDVENAAQEAREALENLVREIRAATPEV